MFSGVNPTVLYIGMIVLVLAAGAGVYFKVIPVEVLIALISALVGHGITVHSVAVAAQKQREQRGNVILRSGQDL